MTVVATFPFAFRTTCNREVRERTTATIYPSQISQFNWHSGKRCKLALTAVHGLNSAVSRTFGRSFPGRM